MDWLRKAARRRPDSAALITADRILTYAELDRAADAVATIITASGLSDTTVAFWGERAPSTVAAVWGIPRAGCTGVPVDPRWPPAEAMSLTREAGARGLWALPEGGVDALLQRRLADEIPAEGPPGQCRFVVFTSGSEGRHKGVILTGENIEASVEASAERLGNGPDDAWLCALPLFHIGGLSILWRQAQAGAPVILHPTFESGAAARALGEAGFASLVPTMLRRALDAGARGTGTLKVALIGGGPVDPRLLEKAISAGIPAVETYGMTETCSQICTVAPTDAARDLGTAGRPLTGAEVRIGDDGRIAVRGAMLSAGYLAEEPRESEWFVTGDLGELDSEGRLRVLGRADAVIVTGGENVHPGRVERQLWQIQGVTEARVFGLPDDEWGRRVVAEVVLDGVTLDDVTAEAQRRLAPEAVPKEWRVVAALSGE